MKEDPNDAKDIPRSFVLSSGAVTKSVKHLVHDFRLVMEPNTATRLKVHSISTFFLLHLSCHFLHHNTGAAQQQAEGFP